MTKVMVPSEKLAFYITPITVPFSFVSGISGFDMQYGILDYLSSVLIIAVFSLPIAYIMELVVVLPIYSLKNYSSECTDRT